MDALACLDVHTNLAYLVIKLDALARSIVQPSALACPCPFDCSTQCPCTPSHERLHMTSPECLRTTSNDLAHSVIRPSALACPRPNAFARLRLNRHSDKHPWMPSPGRSAWFPRTPSPDHSARLLHTPSPERLCMTYNLVFCVCPRSVLQPKSLPELC